MLSWAVLLLSQAAQPAAAAVVPPCRPGREDQEVVVCGRKEHEQRYRLPEWNGEFDPNGDTPSVHLERRRLFDLGATGIGSCSTVGPGGWTGCDLQRWRDAQDQHAGSNRRDGDGPSLRVGVQRRSTP